MWNWSTDKKSRTCSKAEKNWKDYITGMRWESIWLFLLLFFNSFHKGFKGLSKIATIPEHKISQWKKTEKEKIMTENPVKLWLGFAHRNTQHKVFQSSWSWETNLALIFPGFKAKRDTGTVSLPILFLCNHPSSGKPLKEKQKPWASPGLSCEARQGGRWQAEIAS